MRSTTSRLKSIRARDKINRLLKRRLIFRLAILGLILFAITLTAFLFKDSATQSNIGGASFKSLETFLSRGDNDLSKRSQSNFSEGDSIQAGFTYEMGDVTEPDKALVRFIVINQKTKDEVFRTNMFQLDPLKETIFISINNQNLPKGEYRVEARTSDDKKIAVVKITIE